jgi:hypothetical protein
VLESQELHFHSHLERVSEYLNRCVRLLDLVESVEKDVDGCLEEWKLLEEGGARMQGDCERLLEEKVAFDGGDKQKA